MLSLTSARRAAPCSKLAVVAGNAMLRTYMTVPNSMQRCSRRSRIQSPISITTSARNFSCTRAMAAATPPNPAMIGGNFKHGNTTAPEDTNRVMPMFSLKGRTAIVSGAGAGIGLAVAHALAEAGANVAIWYNSNKKAVAEAEKIASTYGVKCKAYQVNITSYEPVERAIHDITKEFNGRLDIFIANSGIPWTQGAAISGEIAHYHKVVDTDLDGTFYCARVCGQIWQRQKIEKTTSDGKPLEGFREGSFVATASMSGHIVNIPQLQATYNAAKAGIIHLCKCLAVEWVGFARCNTVSPGYMATEISDFVPTETKNVWKDKIPMGREGEAHELKGVYLYLASDAASYTTGTDIIVDGGYCLP